MARDKIDEKFRNKNSLKKLLEMYSIIKLEHDIMR